VRSSRSTADRFRLTANEGGNHLHGGALGFGKRLWRVLDCSRSHRRALRLGYRSSDGEEGYPGNLQATVAFEIAASSLRIRSHRGDRCGRRPST